MYAPIITAIIVIAGVEAVTVLSKRVREVNIQARLRVEEEAWPPEQPETFTPLVLIQHQGHRNLKQSTAMAEFVERGHIDKVVTSTKPVPRHHGKLDSHQPLREVLDTSKVTKEVAEILAPLEIGNNPQFVLIEGAPGIGKTVLLREIAYCWGKQQVLQNFKLVILLCLRDPTVQQMSLIDHLLQSFCKGDRRATEITSACGDYLLENDGEDLVLLFDGYDEYPEQLRKDSLIADILKRQVLPRCGLIVSSRPHAAAALRKQATVRVDILGFTEAEREHYIRESMKDQPQKIVELKQYLQSHSTISSLCFVPFNIVVLVYLYKQGIPLPKNSAELYNYFICLTVCRHLAKHGHHFQGSITELTTSPKLTDLPEPYNKIIQQLSKLSLEALNKDQLIFTLDEIKAACPDIRDIPGAIKGFGLLQVVEHFGLTGKTVTFNFLHFSIQEYLAAHYIANLPADEELRIIKEKFWSTIHSNMFLLYVTLTKGQRPSFKRFVCGRNNGISISDKFFNNQLQCLHLYRCFHEAGDVDMCKTIEQSVKLSEKKINLSFTALTASDVECVAVFLTSSVSKEWIALDLYNCYIQDHGLHILHRELLHCSKDITIDKLVLGSNGLTTQSSSLISDITVKCKVKKLGIDGNCRGNRAIGENEQLYSILSSPSTMLEELWMDFTKLSTRGAIALFTALKDNNKLKMLYIHNNAITDDACFAIITVLKKNNSLLKLYIYRNSLTSEAIVNIVNSLKSNKTLAMLWLPKCSEDTEKTISTLQEVINKNRESQGCQVKLRIGYV